jgi:hypothetical protein
MVNPGAHVIAASARGMGEANAHCDVAEGKAGKVELVLSPVAAAPAALEPAPPAAAPRAVEQPAPQSRTLPVALLVGGSAVFAVGLGVGLAGVAQASSAPTRNGSVANAARTKTIAGDVLGSVGIAGAAVGAIVLIVRATRKPSSPAPAAWAVPTPHGLAVPF